MNHSRCKRLVSLATILTLGVLAACSGSTNNGSDAGTISASSYDQSCTKASDCVGIATGPVTCCGNDGCDNAAINKSDESKYEADLVADHPTDCTGTACPALACAPPTLGCVGGMCKVLPYGSGDGGSSDGSKHDSGEVPCGSTKCGANQVCVMDQMEGGALHPPSDAGTCPDGDVLTGSSCSPAPTYTCKTTPSSCSAALSCSCAQSLCDEGFQCMSAKDSQVGCYLLAP
jgi:hypothetical protein